MEDLEAKSSRSTQEPIDLSVGGEDREDSRKARADVWNRYTHNLWRSDAEYRMTRYNESDAASEVSWVIVWLKPKGLTQSKI